MRVGMLSRIDELAHVAKLEMGSVAWMRFSDSVCGPGKTDWLTKARELKAEATSSGIRISAIGALYANPLDADQSDTAIATFRHAIVVASEMGIRTVAGFPGAVIHTSRNERGGNPIYEPFENFIPNLVAFWEPIGRFAADHGCRIAFEHCPQGVYHLPLMGYNMLAQPAMWDRFFDAVRGDNFGLEFDPSHLICQFIDPVETIHRYGSRIFHFHAKDAFINHPLLRRYGICHPGVAEHRFPGLGQSNWAEIVHALIRTGYDSDLNIEGWHDPVYRDHPTDENSPMKGQKMEVTGLRIARNLLAPLVAGTE
ncbi:MAG: Xylose isomerase domain protein barrel [Verrucomicrobiales bacterium]|nr:Xylose isomerase domain protein barrel [Verrucomicrobiales bacterium]